MTPWIDKVRCATSQTAKARAGRPANKGGAIKPADATVGAYDVTVIDRLLPGLDGLSVVKTLRAGGDHHLVKPFAFAELSARIAAIARRPRTPHQPTPRRREDREVDLLHPRAPAGSSICCRANSRF